MRFRFAIFMLFIGNCSLYAQLGNETSNEEEKDRIAIGDNAMNAQRESAWSLSSSNFDWKAPMQVNGRWEAVSLPSRNFNISVPGTSSRQRSGYTQSQIKAHKRAKRVQEHNAWVERRNAEIEAANEAARIRAEERKRRIEEENKRDRERGLMEYYARTAGFHQANAERDHWMATEGIRRLKEDYHATDLADIPQGQFTPKMEGMSGKELANLLNTNEKEESKIEVVSLSILMKDKKLVDDNRQINVTANRYLDEQQMKDWAKAIDEEGLFDISTLGVNSKTKKHEPILLVTHEELELDSLCPFVLPQYGLVALSGDSIIMLKDGELRSIAWIKGCESSYVVVCGDKLIGKNGKRLNIIQSAESEKLLEFDTNQFSIFPKDVKSLYAVCWYNDFSSIIRIEVDKREYSEIARLPLAVLAIAANENMTLALVENDVYLIDSEGKPMKFFKTGEYVNDIVMSEEGLLVATDTHIFMAKNAKEQSVLIYEGAKRLWCDGKDVYYQTLNNDLYLLVLK